MSPEHPLLCARSSVTARGEVKAVPEGVSHKCVPQWDKCRASGGNECNGQVP